MANGTTLNAGAGGDTIYDEDLGAGVKMPAVKLHTGALGVDGGAVTNTNPFPAKFMDPTSGLGVAVAAFHNNDNQSLAGFGGAILAGGVAQLLNPIGNADRQRGAGADGTPATGISTGAASFAAAFSTTITQAITLNAAPQVVTCGATAGALGKAIQINSVVLVDAGLPAAENVIVTAVVPGVSFTAIFTKNHLINAAASTFVFNQERDASGELDGADGRGTAVAAEYEYNGGGPGTANYDRARSVQGKLGVTAAITAGGTNGTATATFAAPPAGLQPGQQVILLGGAGLAEAIYVSANYAGAAAVTFQSNIVGAGPRTSMQWDAFAANGPGLTGFSALGMGIEESIVYDPLSPAGANFFLERSATADAVALQNVVMEGPALFNGATADRARGGIVVAGSGVGFANEISGAVYNAVAPVLTAAQASPMQASVDAKLIIATQQTAIALTSTIALDAAAVSHAVKASPGVLMSGQLVNRNAAVRYFQVFNQTALPPVGTANLVASIAVQPNSSLPLNSVLPPNGLALSTGIVYGWSTTDSTGYTAATAADHSATLFGS